MAGSLLLMILLKEFINLNANTDMIIKNVKSMELNTNIVKAVKIIQTLEVS